MNTQLLDRSNCNKESNSMNNNMTIEQVLVHAKEVLGCDDFMLEFLAEDLRENYELYKALA